MKKGGSKSDLPKFHANFQVMQQIDVPQSRNGKHRKIVREILDDVKELKVGTAMKIPMAALGDTKENVRAALSRATRKRGIVVSTAADADFLYIWRTEE